MFYYLPFFLSAALIFIVGLFTLKKINLKGGVYLSGVCLAATVWAFTEGMLYIGLDLETCKTITFIQYFGIALLPPFALLFGLTIFSMDLWASRVARTPLFVVVIIIILLVWTNPFHHLVFTEYYPITTGPFPMLG